MEGLPESSSSDGLRKRPSLNAGMRCKEARGDVPARHAPFAIADGSGGADTLDPDELLEGHSEFPRTVVPPARGELLKG